MRVIIQRVKRAAIKVEDGERKEMGAGMVALFGVSEDDRTDTAFALAEKLAAKTANIRIFSDGEGKMNLSAPECGYSMLAVPNFTLFADTKRGNRPSFAAAAKPPFAKELYDSYVFALQKYGWSRFLTGTFGAMMEVEIVGDGPVTILIDTKEWER